MVDEQLYTVDVTKEGNYNKLYFKIEFTAKTYTQFLEVPSSKDLQVLYLQCNDYPGITRDILMCHNFKKEVTKNKLTFIK